MEEKKKTARPTWTMIRMLEDEVKELREKLNSQIDGTSRLVGDCDAWRDKYRKLSASEEELKKKQFDLIDRVNSLKNEVLYLRSRSLWQRIINK